MDVAKARDKVANGKKRRARAAVRKGGTRDGSIIKNEKREEKRWANEQTTKERGRENRQ